jgi:hypothetical protein
VVFLTTYPPPTPRALGPRALLRRVRRVADDVERALRPELSLPPPAAGDLDHVDDTRELLLPNLDEPPVARAQRQARLYLERRRRKLADDLAARHGER